MEVAAAFRLMVAWAALVLVELMVALRRATMAATVATLEQRAMAAGLVR
jgi:hypothetical protein